ncbi:MAG: SycD/LcrH family type III secretion system chaperone [Chlamydiales bacterium]|nr:SycD/LcrH family type III secretion system chaperone [Chlamydiales bacterium]
MSLSNSLPQKDLESVNLYLKKVLIDHFNGKELLQDACDISNASVEKLYTKAYEFYQAGDSLGAINAFGLLIHVDPFSQVFWMGLGSARQLNSEHEKALQAFAIAALLDDQDPAPHYHAAQNYLALNNEEDALKALDLAEALSTMSAMHAPFQERVAKLKGYYYQTYKGSYGNR